MWDLHVRAVATARGQCSGEAVDDPVFADACRKVLGAFLVVIAQAVPFAFGDELDDDRRKILARVRSTSKPGPDDSISPAAAVVRGNMLFGERIVECGALGMLHSVEVEQHTKLFIGPTWPAPHFLVQ